MASDADLIFWGERGDDWAEYVLRDRQRNIGRLISSRRRLSLNDERPVE